MALFPLAALLVPFAPQEPLVSTFDMFPSFGSVVHLRDLSVANSGRWSVEVFGSSPGEPLQNALLRDGIVSLVYKGPVPGYPGATVFRVDGFEYTPAGRLVSSLELELDPGNHADTKAVFLEDFLVLEIGDPVTAPGVGAGTSFQELRDVRVGGERWLLVRGEYDDPLVPGEDDSHALLVEIDSVGNVVAQTKVAAEGDVPPGQSLAIDRIRTRIEAAAVNAAGEVLWCADLDPLDLAGDSVVYLDGTLLAQEGTPTGFGGIWGELERPRVDLNDAGDWTLVGDLAGGDEVIVKNGQRLVGQGDTLPDIQPFTLESFGEGSARLTEDGRVFWYARWSDPDTSRDEGYFLDGHLIVQEGVTVGRNGQVIRRIRDGNDAYEVSKNGEWFLFEGQFRHQAIDFDTIYRMDLWLGTAYCVSSVNSTGSASHVYASGSASVAENALHLSATNVPVQQTGRFFYGPGAVQVPFGNGVLCVGGGILSRLPVETAGADGLLEHTVDLTSPPTPAGAITAGSTWYFQAWYRDFAAGGALFDLSDGREITFGP